MQSNQLYDRIIEIYNSYTNYNKFVENKQKELQDRKKEIALKILNSIQDESEIEEITRDIFLNIEIYNRDAHIIFIKLYNMVESYLLLTEVTLLPDEITELCTSLSYIYPKTILIIEDNGEAREQERGLLEKFRQEFKESGKLEAAKEKIKKILNV